MTQVFITNTNSDLQASSTPDYWTDLSSAGALGIWLPGGNSGHGAWTQSALYNVGATSLPAISATNFPTDGNFDHTTAQDGEAIADQMSFGS